MKFTYVCQLIPVDGSGPTILPFPGPQKIPPPELMQASIDNVCFQATTWMAIAIAIIFVAVIGIIGYSIGRAVFRGKTVEKLSESLQISERRLAALDRRFYSRASVWISLVLISSGTVLTLFGTAGSVKFDLGPLGRMDTSVPGIAAALFGLVAWRFGRPRQAYDGN